MVELANYKNKTFVLLDFWASWCMPCLKEIPKMKEVYKKYNEKGLLVYHWIESRIVGLRL